MRVSVFFFGLWVDWRGDYGRNEHQQLKWKDRVIQGELLKGGTPAHLGGRCFCIRYPVGRGRGPARF